MTGREVYAFGDLTLDIADPRLSRNGRSIPLAPRAHACTDGGRPAVVRWTIETQGSHLPTFQLALLHSELGNLDDALGHLDQAIDRHEPCLVDLAVAPQWDRLRADPRFVACLARIGLGN